MKLAIVGSRSLRARPDVLRIIEGLLDEHRPAVVISGGAKGVDSIAEQAARRRGVEVVVHRPDVPNWLDGYRPRNLRIARECTMLICIVDSGTRWSYGGRWTRNRAAEMGKPVRTIWV